LLILTTNVSNTGAMKYKLWVTYRLRSKGNVPNTSNILYRCRFISCSLIGQACCPFMCNKLFFEHRLAHDWCRLPWGRRYSVLVLLPHLRMESCRSTAVWLAVCLPFRLACICMHIIDEKVLRTETRVSKFGAHDDLVAPWRKLWFAEDHGRGVRLSWKHGLAISKCLLISNTIMLLTHHIAVMSVYFSSFGHQFLDIRRCKEVSASNSDVYNTECNYNVGSDANCWS